MTLISITPRMLTILVVIIPTSSQLTRFAQQMTVWRIIRLEIFRARRQDYDEASALDIPYLT